MFCLLFLVVYYFMYVIITVETCIKILIFILNNDKKDIYFCLKMNKCRNLHNKNLRYSENITSMYFLARLEKEPDGLPLELPYYDIIFHGSQFNLLLGG